MKFLMAANWKMNKTRSGAVQCLEDLLALVRPLPKDREVAVFAPFTVLDACSNALAGAGEICLGGQNCYHEDSGAFTGEISPDMLKDVGCSHVLTGHSERRAIFGESDEQVGKKTAFALSRGLKVVLCIGETLEERDSGKLVEVLERQLEKGLVEVPDNVSTDDLAVAYEPVWAIGTGRVAGPKEIVDTHALVRAALVRRFPSQGAQIRILYGGSVKADNAKEIIALDNVNGVLVGGASLIADSFSKIVLA